MAQSVKEMLIKLNGEVGAGANKIGDYLTGLGSMLDRIGKHTREFEKESVNVYRSYEDQMLAAKFALSAQVDSATELERQMAGLDEAARKWASTSIFHTDDVSKAINEAAHAGWQYQEILEGIPEAMLIAQAGGLDLSNGLDYLVKMMNATKTPMSEIGTIVDQWAMAANISATNIDELGEAFMSMGAAAQFGDSTAELFSMLAALANVGTTGSKAGTALRNTIMRLIAPTTKAEAAMDLLGADAEELQEVLTDENVTKAAKTLEGLGFSAFERDTGKLKPVKQIFEELFALTENLDEAAKDELLAAIFPTRTIATALSLLSASDGELQQIFDKVSNSEGYAKKGADIMMSGLTGSIETLKSKWEEFERSIGETLAPHIERISGFLGNITDGLNNMSPEALEGVTSMLTAMSAVGPLLIGAGAVAKLVGFLGPIGTLGLAAGLGISFLVGYLTKLAEIDFESNFGTLTVDLEELGKYVDGIESKFDIEQQAITKYSQAVQEAQKNYNDALTGMNEGLLKKVLTGGTFTDDDFKAFETLGNDIVKWTMTGIQNAEASDLTLLQAMFGDKSSAEQEEAFDNAAGLLDYYYGDLEDEATKIGEEIRKKLTEALKNGELTADDRQAIQAQISRLNQINAEIAARMQEQEYYKQLEKAGRVSWDTVDSFLEQNAQKLESAKEAVNDRYDTLKATLKAAEAHARKEGKSEVSFIDSAGNERTIDLSDRKDKNGMTAMDRMYAELEGERALSIASEESKYGDVSAEAIDALMRDSDFDKAWDVLKDYYANKGKKTFEEVLGSRSEEEASAARLQLENLKGKAGKIKDIMNPFAANPQIYAYMRALEMIGQENLEYRAGHFMDTWTRYMIDNDLGGWTANGFYGNTELEDKRSELEAANSRLASLRNEQSRYQSEIEKAERQLNGQDRGIFYKGDAATQASLEGYKVTKEQIDLDVQEAEAKVSELEATIAAMETEKNVILGVDAKQVDEWEPPDKYGTVHYSADYNSEDLDENAYGGRATEAAIFGEAGPEWAIPEAHTERTAELLNAAREASGFTWGDLISRFGGLNANPGNSPVVLNYSPVITAGDANGVAGVLAADKDRVLKMIKRALEDAKYRDSVEAYA